MISYAYVFYRIGTTYQKKKQEDAINDQLMKYQDQVKRWASENDRLNDENKVLRDENKKAFIRGITVGDAVKLLSDNDPDKVSTSH